MCRSQLYVLPQLGSSHCLNRSAGPIACLQIGQVLSYCDLHFSLVGDILRSFLRSFEMTAVNRIEWNNLEAFGGGPRLFMAFFIKMDALSPTWQPALLDPVIGGVPHKDERCH